MSAPTGNEHEAANLDGSQAPKRQGRIPADTFANRLVLARKLAGMTIRDAASAAGLNYGSWSNWENGKRPIDILQVVDAISEALDIDQEWLLFGGPLAGPKGREVRRVTKRPTSDTVWNSTSPVRSSSRRPMSGRPNGRGDSTRPKVGRPVVIDSSLGGIADRLGDVA